MSIRVGLEQAESLNEADRRNLIDYLKKGFWRSESHFDNSYCSVNPHVFVQMLEDNASRIGKLSDGTIVGTFSDHTSTGKYKPSTDERESRGMLIAYEAYSKVIDARERWGAERIVNEPFRSLRWDSIANDYMETTARLTFSGRIVIEGWQPEGKGNAAPRFVYA